MASVMVLPRRWLPHRLVLATIFGFFLTVFPDVVHPGDHEHLTEDFLSVADSVAFNTLANDIVGKVFSSP